jgi:hypothetical protein
MLTGDRAMTAAQDADGPRAIAAAAWYVNHVHRDAGEASEARVEPAEQAAAPPRPGRRGTLGGIGPRPTPPPTGSAMVEAIGAKKIGKVMGFVGSYVQLRLVGGGTEWDAEPDKLRPVTAEEALSAGVSVVNARSRGELP